MYTINKCFTFPMGHRLVNGYIGGCASPHGHNLIVRAALRTDVLDEVGFVRDYGDLKKLDQWLKTYWDHTMILSKNDNVGLDVWAYSKCLLEKNGEEPWRLFVLDNNPTSENIAKYTYDRMKTIYEDGRVRVAWVEIDETCTTSCHYEE